MPSQGSSAPRPVADAPVVALADGSVVAKAWLLELVAAADLAAAADLPVAELARDAPALAAALVAALGSDAPLAELRKRASAAGRLAGARTPDAAVGAVEALRRATWECLADALPRGDDALATALALRLAHVAAVAAQAAAGGAGAGPAGRDRAARPPFPVRPPWPADAGPEPPASPASPASPEAGPVAEPAIAGPVAARDARAAAQGPPVAGAPAVAEPWLRAIDERLAAHATDERSFCVLLVEVDDLDRLFAAATGPEVSDAMDRAEAAVRGEVPSSAGVVRERAGRLWIVAPDTGRSAGRLLAERVAATVGGAAEHHGTPLTASIGLATCPDDGMTGAELAERADEGVFTARAAGVRIA